MTGARLGLLSRSVGNVGKTRSVYRRRRTMGLQVPYWLMALGAMAMLIPIGMALYSSGLSRSKNAAGAMLRSILSFTCAILAFWAVGVAIYLRAEGRLFGLNPKALVGWSYTMG